MIFHSNENTWFYKKKINYTLNASITSPKNSNRLNVLESGTRHNKAKCNEKRQFPSNAINGTNQANGG